LPGVQPRTHGGGAMTPHLCPECRGPLDTEHAGRRQRNAGRECRYCPSCRLVFFPTESAYAPAERRDLA
jgi:hypothetical protein